MKTTPLPPEWGDDGLSEFLELAHRNRFATFVNKPDWYRRLADVDACFATISRDWINPQSEVAAFLLLRCHSAYRAACGAALAGQTVEAFVLLRAGLEAAGYALHIQRNAPLAVTWLKRHDSDDDMKAAKKSFEIRAIKKTLAAADRKTSEVFEMLYQRTIDHGAHPNVHGILGSATIERKPGCATLQHILLHGDGMALDHALKTTAQIGVCCLDILECGFRARFELLGVRHALMELRKGL